MPTTLDTLLQALRQAGLHVGVTEMLRLQQVCARQPERLPGDDAAAQRRFKALLRAIIVKSQDEQPTFERVCDAWLQRADQDMQRLSEPPPAPVSTPKRDQSTPGRWQAQRVVRALAGVALVLLVIGVYWANPPDHKPPVLPAPAPIASPPPTRDAALADTGTHPRQRSFTNHVPQLRIVAAQPLSRLWLLGLSGCGLLTAMGVWSHLRRRRFVPAPAPPPTRQGPPRVFLTPPTFKEPQFLDTRQQETLVWGITRFIADAPTPRLDLAATVHATARAGGLPTLRYQPATYQREVWLWVDDTAEDSAMTRLADEVEATLLAHGLVVERAVFRGLPERLRTATGEVLTPRDLDERRAAVLVAVLTDGRVLSRLYSADNWRVRIEALCRDLSHWPHLAFVDWSAGASGLAAVLARHALPCIAPAALASFLGGETTPRPTPDLQGDATLWAAACALAPSSVDSATALTLLQHLQSHSRLTISPWALRALHTEAPGPAGRLQWPPQLRAARLNWLRDVEATSGQSVLHTALAFWDSHLQQERQRREANEAVTAWHGTPAKQHLRMEGQLLRLWYAPEEAIPALYALWQGRLRDVIQQHVSQYAPGPPLSQPPPSERPGPPPSAALIHLPWTWEARSATEQAMLQAMGLGGDVPVTRLRRPGRFWLGLGACTGLAIGAALALWLRPVLPPTGPPIVQYEATLPAALQPYVGWWIAPQPLADGQWQVMVSTPKAVAVATVAPAATVYVTTPARTQPCVQALPGDAELWSCGTRDKPERLGPAIRRSLVFLHARPGLAAVEALALALLDSGSADAVLIAPDWVSARVHLLGRLERLGPQQQLILVQATGAEPAALPPPTQGAWVAQVQVGDWAVLTQHLRFAGEKPLAEVWPPSAGLLVQGAVRQVRLHGLGAWPDVVFVPIPAGTFLMGSPDDEVGRDKDEGPQHPVTVPAFEMARTETSNAQWRVFRPAHQKQDDLPVAHVTWEEAGAFCTRYGWRLPTEAEWEYTARAGTHTRWSFGDDERQLGEYAWYKANAQGRAHPVGSKQPNPWGLYDMHGNVWEWVQGCWDDTYDKAPGDGRAWETDPCTRRVIRRVIRGGSFDDPPVFLRSAYRIDVHPVDQFDDLGFRCVRVPPQP